jgi:hypothetical protein
MTKKLAVKEMVTVREMLLANSIQVDALSQLLIDKGLITQEEFFSKLKKVQADYLRKQKNATVKV